MDFGTTLKHLAPFLVPILALCIPIVAIIMSTWSRIRRNAHMHQTVRLMVERGQAVPPELIHGLMDDTSGDKKAASWSSAAHLRFALVSMAVGLGLMLFLSQLPDEQEPVWLVGCIPFFVGVALWLAWRVERGQRTGHDTAPTSPPARQ